MDQQRLAASLLVFSSVVSACSGGTGPKQADLGYFRFPAGDARTVVELSARDLDHAPNWYVDKDRAVQLSAWNDAEGGLRLEEVAHVLRLPGGRLVAAAGRAAQAVILSADGTALTTIGRKGAGPGEFQYPTWLGLCGEDRLWIFDRLATKLAIYDLDGVRLDELLILPGQAPAMGNPTCNSAGELVVAGQREMPEDLQFGPFRPFMTLSARQIPDGEFRPVVRVPGPDSYRWERQIGPLGDFARQPLYTLASTSLFVATGDAFEIAEFDTDGRFLTLIRVDDVKRSPVTSTDLDRVRNEQLAATGDQYRARLARTLDSMTWPAFQPVLEEILADSSNCLWVRHYQPDPSPAVWRILGRRGEPVGVVHLPPEFVLTQATNNELVGYSPSPVDGYEIISYPYTRTDSPAC